MHIDLDAFAEAMQPQEWPLHREVFKKCSRYYNRACSTTTGSHNALGRLAFINANAVQDKTREQLGSSLQPTGIAGLVAQADWPTDVHSQDEDLLDAVNIQSLEEVILEEQGQYVVIYGRADSAEQVCM